MKCGLFAFPRRSLRSAILLNALVTFLTAAVYASEPDEMTGLRAMSSVAPYLNGAGVRVAQAETEVSAVSPPPFEINPSAGGILSASITYFTGPPTTVLPQSGGAYPNSLGSESWHADAVGNLFYGFGVGVSTNIAHVDNYEAQYFFFTVVPGLIAINDSIVNQSFVANTFTNVQQQVYDSHYDNYAAQFGALFVSGIGNGGAVNPPSTCYNGLGVGAFQGSSSVGPTVDNGRAKPDLVAPAGATSYSTPLVSGAAALLLQAGLRGEGGNDTNSVIDLRTLKALLINGAVKPVDWGNPGPSPLDPRYGAGVLNVFNSYNLLLAGKHSYIESSTVSAGSTHPPLSATTNINSRYGWDLSTVTSSALTDGVNHYYFSLLYPNSGARFTGTITLVWNRQFQQTDINDLDLYLYEISSGNLIASSTSGVDNVEHIYVPQLAQGRYDLQVLKHGGTTVSSSETYALAFEFICPTLNITKSGTNALVTWPLYPAGFRLETSTDPFAPGTWQTGAVATIINQQSTVTMQTVGSNFFRLARP
jgi:hypothetical protein